LTLIRRALPRAIGPVARTLLLPVILALALAACSNNANRAVAGSVGVGTNVAISTPGEITQLYEGQEMPIAGSILAGPADGIAWSCTDQTGQPCANSNTQNSGTLSLVTSSSVQYNAPSSGVAGAISVLITATSIAEPSNYAQLTLLVQGTPVMNAQSLYPGNVGNGYEAEISATGGDQPLTWAQCTSSVTTNTACNNAQAANPSTYPGSLPPGLILDGSTTGVTVITGTATATGTYSFWVTVSDDAGNYAAVLDAAGNPVVDSTGTPVPMAQEYTITITPQTACLLGGQYVFTVSGFRGGGPASHSGAIDVDATTGVITGEQDYKDGNRVTPHETLLSTSTCVNRDANSGQIILRAPSGAFDYDFSVTPPDSSGVIHTAYLQLIGSGEDSAAGQMTLQEATAVTGTPPSGSFAFGMLGASNTVGTQAVRFGTIGSFVSDGSGTISAGEEDSNASSTVTSPALTPLTAAALTGSLTAPDSYGRGTATFTTAGQSESLVYYILNANKMYLMDVGTTVGTPRLSGFLTPQTGDVSATTFDNNALALQPSIMSQWGTIGTIEPIVVDSLGRLSNGNAAAGTIDLLLDTTAQGVNTAGAIYSGLSYSVASNGRGTLALNDGTTTRNFVFYLDGIADGYILEQGSAAGSAGLLEAQYVPDGGVYPTTLSNNFIGVTPFPQAPGPIVLLPLLALNFGTLQSDYASGSFSLDATIGRGFGDLTLVASPLTDAAYYIVSPTKIDLIDFAYGLRFVDGTLIWMTQN
jgi:hypothetical protein